MGDILPIDKKPWGGIALFNILVVEDDRELNKTVCSFLNHSGYVATGCLNAADAYDALYENVFDLIVSDIMMARGLEQLYYLA